MVLRLILSLPSVTNVTPILLAALIITAPNEMAGHLSLTSFIEY